jgi:asparagine synthase (glutamine-hydrolysing)
MFRAPLDSFFIEPVPAWVGQLLSPESLAKTRYFDVAAVRHWLTAYKDLRKRGKARFTIEMGLVGVLSTQLWHHTFVGGSLADLPTEAGRTPRSVKMTPARPVCV